jgi:hypothetical protein
LVAWPFKLVGLDNAYQRLCSGMKMDASKLRKAGWRSFQPVDEAFRDLGRKV